MNANHILFVLGVVIFVITTILGLIGILTDLDTTKLTNNYLLGIGMMIMGLGSKYFETKKKGDKE